MALVRSGVAYFVARLWLFLRCSEDPLSLGSLTIVVCPMNNSCNFTGNYELSFWSWNDIITQTNEAPVLKYITARPLFQRRRKIRRHRRPWAYYSNTTATFHDLLIGDLVFKLNPGPTGERIPVIVSTRSDYRHKAQSTMPSRNTGSLINVNCCAGLSCVWIVPRTIR